MSSTFLTVRIDWTAGGAHDTHSEGQVSALKAWLESSPVIAEATVLLDVDNSVVGSHTSKNPPEDDDEGEEARADGIRVGDWVREEGMDEWVYVKSLSWHGDTILIWGADGSEGSFDQDTSVEIIRR